MRIALQINDVSTKRLSLRILIHETVIYFLYFCFNDALKAFDDFKNKQKSV